jgi:hypothetical protein
MAWLCVKDNSLKWAQMCIVTGPRIELAVTLVDRLKRLFTATELSISKNNLRIIK